MVDREQWGSYFTGLLERAQLRPGQLTDRLSTLHGQLTDRQRTALEDVGIDTSYEPGSDTISRWGTGERIPLRKNLLVLIWGFHALDVLATVDEANQWLTLGGKPGLSDEEAIAIFGRAALTDEPSSVPFGHQALPPTEQNDLTQPVPPSTTAHQLPLSQLFRFAREIFTPLGNAQQARVMLCRRVRRIWIEDLLHNSLYDEDVTIDLVLEERRDLINDAWADVIATRTPLPRELLRSSRIDELFDRVERRLLIVGDAGVGKTTLLLQLADKRIVAALENRTEPLPVILNLIVWSGKKGLLSEWIVEEIAERYFIPKRIAQHWIKQERLLLLLDGLDEVPPNDRAECVTAINQFLTEHPMPVVICARVADYLAVPHKLNVENALLIQHLSPPQVDHYLTQVGIPVTLLHDMVVREPALAVLLSTPIFIHLFIETQAALQSKGLMAQHSSYIHLLDLYVTQMMASHRTRQYLFSHEEAESRFCWLAAQLNDHSLNHFVIEQLQPSWLANTVERYQYLVLSRLLIGVVGGFWGGIVIGGGFAIFYNAGLEGLSRGFVEGLIAGASGGLMLIPIDLWRLTHARSVRRQVTLVSFLGMLLETAIITIAVGGGVFGGIVLLLGLQQWWGYSLNFWIGEGGIVGLLTGLSFGLFFGYRQWHTGRRGFQEDIATIEQVTWSNIDALRGAIYGALFGGMGGLFMWINGFIVPISLLFPNSRVLALMTFIGIVLGTIFGGLTGQVITPAEQLSQTMLESLRSALGLAIFISLLCALFGLIISAWQAETWRDIGTFALYGLFTGPLAFLWYGGVDMVKHFILRLLLHVHRHLPWQIRPFLEFATAVAILYRAGHGYTFIHPLLREHFAERFYNRHQQSDPDINLRRDK